MKEFKTLEEQIELLKTRNILFNDEESTRKILLHNNYYNIINGYKDLYYASAIGITMTVIMFPMVMALKRLVFNEGKEN